MGWNTQAFFGAFKRSGMLDEASFQPPTGPPVSFDVGFKRPDQVVLDGVVHSTDYSIEYQAADVELKRNDTIQITGEGSFVVRQTPMAQGDGTYVIAILGKV